MRSAILLSVICLACPSPLQAEDCAEADPYGVITSQIIDAHAGKEVGTTDFEVVVDPQDSYKRVLFTTNLANGTSKIIVARLDGRTGIITDPAETNTIATNYQGNSALNGPEWFQRPNGQVGLLYPGPNGIHAVFRPATPGASGWSRFQFDVNGRAITNQQPPPLANTAAGAYPFSQPPFLLSIYAQWGANCPGSCLGYLDATVTTDIGDAMSQNGLVGSHGLPNPNRDGYFFINACTSPGQDCAIYEAALNYDGGLAPGSLKRLAATESDLSDTKINAGQHPVTGDTVLFALDTNNGRTVVRVFRQAASGGPLMAVGQIPVPADARHFRVNSDSIQSVFRYQSQNDAPGTYVVPVTAAGTALAVGSTKRVSAITSTETVVWLPIANRWAFYYNYSSVSPPVLVGLRRCWFTP